MKCGFCKKMITPPLGTPLIGYYRERLAKGVWDDLYARAVAFESDGVKAVIVQLDLCLETENVCDLWRKTVAEFCNMDENAVFISCNHTHTGPLTTKDFASDKVADPHYMDFLEKTIRDAAFLAFEDVKPARFFVAEGQAKSISFVRRYRMKDGSVRTNPDALDPNIDYPLDQANETVKLLKILREGGDDIFLFNFGTHSDTIGGEYISADYSGYACQALEGAIPGIQSAFILAPQGDVNHRNVFMPNIGLVGEPQTPAHARHMGRVIAGTILQICDRAVEIGSEGIRFGTSFVEVPSHQENDKLEEAIRVNTLYEAGRGEELAGPGKHLTAIVAEARRIIRLKDGPASFTKKLSALRVGEMVFAGYGGEPFTAIRNRTEAESPFANTFVCALVNDSGGYFPSTKAYSEGGYEVLTSSFGPGTDDVLVGGMTKLLHSLK